MPDDPPRTEEIEEDDDWGGGAGGSSGGGAGPEGSAAAAPTLAGKRRTALLAGAAALVIAAAGYWYFAYGPGSPPPPPPPVVEAEPEPVVEEDPEPEIPALGASDPFLRALLAALTDNPDALAWLLGDELARRIAVATDNVADGMSPRRALAGLAPADSFRAAGDGAELHVHPEAFARYDSLADAIAGADSPGMVEVIRTAMPIFDEAYAELGRPDRTFADALLAALDRLAAVPLPEEPVLLEERIMRYAYRVPALEDLDEASKHLLRFGPDNQRKVQAAVRSLAERLRAGGAPF